PQSGDLIRYRQTTNRIGSPNVVSIAPRASTPNYSGNSGHAPTVPPWAAEIAAALGSHSWSRSGFRVRLLQDRKPRSPLILVAKEPNGDPHGNTYSQQAFPRRAMPSLLSSPRPNQPDPLHRFFQKKCRMRSPKN